MASNTLNANHFQVTRLMVAGQLSVNQDNVIPKQPAVNNCKVVNNIGGSWLEKRLLKLKCSAKQHEAAKNHN
ncbi:Uncharacterised protein [Vibrio cholerae]|nr:Uncharacterised protein [Vibrio cholerae]